MDVSASTSFESSPDKRSSTYVGDNTLYDSALDHQLSTTAYKSCNESLISELSQNPLNLANKTGGAEFGNESAVFKSFGSPAPAAFNSPTPALNASMLLIQSESTDTNTSQEEVDPKSQLANKTIFKTDNPNLSIIEINDNSIKEEDLEKVVLVEGDSVKNLLKKSPSKDAAANADKRRRKESLLQTSKQKLDISIAEASAAADGDGEKRDLVPVIDQPPQTKREITIYDTIEEFEQNLPSTVTLLNTPFGSKVYLVGTAHFSEESQDDVSYVIRNVRPDVVMVELCPSRIHILKLDEKTLLEEAKSINIPKIRGILHTHGYINGIFFILLLQMSAQIAKDLGMAPGGEFRRAFEEIHKLPGCILHLGDRPIRITLYRALRALSLWQTMKLVWRLTFTDSISIEEVEECKQSDLLEKLMQEMAGEFPAFSDVFVRERDLFLCHSLQLAALPQAAPGAQQIRPVRVVGVVGIGHANGIAKMWGTVDPKKIPAILEIPPASIGQRVCKYTLKYGLIGLGCYGAFRFFRPRLTRFF
ncbi:traB domain-containing protein [Drosophila biarmipes]|uniref:traB domain-containing protein n=1 Tax=Drosophila biarmipes TaxID=125945 RepID=UPI0007E8752A|nr:traB domain-containing protein [Drosophila biarmipes]XP_016949215.1 traB domain-containing protein [Drosophila biarmipes]XP_016949223.1 traB domain-containing protein [Drosophila biarmipes]